MPSPSAHTSPSTVEASPAPSTTERLMTIDEAFCVAMNRWSSLYAATTLELAKLKFYDQVFNTIGSGSSTMEELCEKYALTPDNAALTRGFPDKYIGTAPLYYAYTETTSVGSCERPKYGTDLPGLYIQEEIDAMDHVATTVLSNRSEALKGETKVVPYPNFQKRYSLVWNVDLNALDPSWVEAALTFYRFAKTFFDSEASEGYSSAVPKDCTRLIRDYEEAFAKYRRPGMDEAGYHAAISKAYELPYTGDTEDFIRRRWAIEKARILAFLEETTGMLEATIAQQNASRKTPAALRSRP